MKRKKAIKHRIEQKTANRKNARRRRFYEFRMIAKSQRERLTREINVAQMASDGDAASPAPPSVHKRAQRDLMSGSEYINKPS